MLLLLKSVCLPLFEEVTQVTLRLVSHVHLTVCYFVRVGRNQYMLVVNDLELAAFSRLLCKLFLATLFIQFSRSTHLLLRFSVRIVRVRIRSVQFDSYAEKVCYTGRVKLDTYF